MTPVELLLSAVSLLAVANSVAGYGTVVHLFNALGNCKKNTLPTGTGLWLVPSPLSGSAGSPPGCTNLPAAYQLSVKSGEIYWNASAGTDQCQFLWFFFDLNCANVLGNWGIQRAKTGYTKDCSYPANKYYPWVQWAKSIACSYSPDPCKAYPCPDPNALCTSTLPNTLPWVDPATKIAWTNQTRTCACKPGFMKSATGTCVAAPPPPPPTTPQNAWLPPLNTYRAAKSPSAASLVWDASLATIAQSQTDLLNTKLCTTFLAGGANATLMQQLKLSGSTYSENDAWQYTFGGTPSESTAVDSWTVDVSKPPAARIYSPTSQKVGCAKTLCGSYSFFFTCLFTPFTY